MLENLNVLLELFVCIGLQNYMFGTQLLSLAKKSYQARTELRNVFLFHQQIFGYFLFGTFVLKISIIYEIFTFKITFNYFNCGFSFFLDLSTRRTRLLIQFVSEIQFFEFVTRAIDNFIFKNENKMKKY